MVTVVFLTLCLIAVRFMVYALLQFGRHAMVPDPSSRLGRAVRVSRRNDVAQEPIIRVKTPKACPAHTRRRPAA
jgi:hypothetical protein